MKTMILTLITLLGMATVASARSDTITLRQGQQKTAARGEVTVKFVTVTEDSRCPVDVDCIWAGNAKIEVRVATRHGSPKTMVMNTTMGPKGDQEGGWAISLTSLTPAPRSGKKINRRSYTATFTITRLQR